MLLQNIRNNPKKYDFHGFLNQTIFNEFFQYVTTPNSKIQSYNNLFSWYKNIFGLCSVHNIECERGFSVMRFLQRTKYPLRKELQTMFLQSTMGASIEDAHKIQGLDYLYGLLEEQRLSEDEVISMIEDLSYDLNVPTNDIRLYLQPAARSTPDDEVKLKEVFQPILTFITKGLSAFVSGLADYIIQYSMHRQAILNTCLEMNHDNSKLFDFDKLIPAAVE